MSARPPIRIEVPLTTSTSTGSGSRMKRSVNKRSSGPERFFADVEPHRDDQDRVRAAYGEDAYRRLAMIKGVHDPDNIFRLNDNITPARPSLARFNDACASRANDQGERWKLPILCQSSDQEEIRGATTNRDPSGSRLVDDLDKQVESGSGGNSKDGVFIT